MEDPLNEMEGVVRGCVDKPTLRRQAQTLKKYFTEDVKFYHFYINLNTGLRSVIAIYQMAQLMLNYRFVISPFDYHCCSNPDYLRGLRSMVVCKLCSTEFGC